MMNSGKTSGLLERTGAAAKLALALLLVMTMVVYVPPLPSSQAYAYDGPVGSIKYGGKKIEYDEYAELEHDLENLANEEVTVEMYCDWSPDTVGMKSGLHIPVGARVTLNMNGHLFDRGSTGKEANDPCVQVHSGATLTVNGGDRSHEHDMLAYTSLSGDTKGTVRSGGVITGGNVGRRDSEAGGIKVEKGTVTLNDVTIIGCSPRGIDTYKSTVNLNNSVIEANKEGGIYSWETTIKLSNSHIKDNYSADGGGVLAQNATTIEGDGSSSITGNVAANYGGGVCAYNCPLVISGVQITGNKAAIRGGGVHAGGGAYDLRNLTIEGNEAKRGGGVYVEMLYFTLNYEGNGVMSDCTIQNNTAERYGGVYAHEYYNEDWALNGGTFSHSLSGALVVKDNAATDGSGYNNYCIEVNRDHWVNNRSSFKLGEGAEVWLSVVENPGLDFVNETIHDADCAQYLHSDQTGYIFEYDSESSLIQRTTGQEGDTTSKQTVTAANANDASGKDNSAQERTVAGKVGTVGAGGADGDEYDKVRGFFMRDNEDQFGVFYYSDGLFYGEPTAYNEHLATLTWALAYVGGYLNEDKEAVNGNKYYNKHAAARQFFADIGCPDQNIYVNDYNLVKPGTDSIGVAIASKELERIGEDGKKEKTGDILIPVTVRGMGYETEWLSNVTLGTATEMADSGAEAKGFSEAATQVMNEIEYYLQKYNLEEAFAEGHVKFWVTGFSRAGATANLVSKRLVDKVAAECKGEDKSEVFAYPCEAPKGGTDKAEVPGNDYTCIHNMINAVDIVPFVAPELMGFKRYGVDHYIPGTDAGTVKTTQKAVQRGGDGGPDTVTTYADNEICYTKTAAYNSQRELMLRQLKALDPGMKFDDYFRPVAMNFIDFKIENPLKKWPPYSYDTMRQYYNGDENNQVEYFVADFIRLAQEGIDAGYGGRSEAVPSRDYYAKDKIADNYALLQDSARDLMYVFMTSELGGFLDRAGNIKDDMSYVSWLPGQMSMLKMYGEIRGWYKRTEGQKRATVSDLWEALKDTGALDKLDATTRSKMESAFPAVGYVALTLANADYVHHPADNPEGYQWAKGSNETMMSLPTLMRYYKYIISCHMPQINMAWARTYDSWYAEEYNAYGLERPGSVDAPQAYGIEAGKQKQLDAESSARNILVGDQRITLENPEIVGEAIYYSLWEGPYAGSREHEIAYNELYRGGIDLTLGDNDAKYYTLRVYSLSYGKSSPYAEYRITLTKGTHKVIVRDMVDQDTSSTRPVSSLSGDGRQSETTLVAGEIGGGSAETALSAASTGVVVAVDRERTCTYAEGDRATAQASVPTSKYFKRWKVQSLDKNNQLVNNGNEVDLELYSLEVARSRNPVVTFTMPSSNNDTHFPERYSLLFTAEYGTRISTVNASALAAPVGGKDLSKWALVSFDNGADSVYCPVSWTYRDGDKDVVTSGPAYRSTVYTATVTVPQDEAKDVMFNEAVTVQTSNGTVKDSYTRNDDGSITFDIVFPATGNSGDSRPTATMHFDVQGVNMHGDAPFDLDPAIEYNVHPSEIVTITAPDVKGMQFVGWDLGDSGIELAGDDGNTLESKTVILQIPTSFLSDETSITACYKPLVSQIDVSLYKASSLFSPEGGKRKQDRAVVSVTIGDDVYEIFPACVELTWSPELDRETFLHQVEYTATAKLVEYAVPGGGYYARKQGTTQYGITFSPDAIAVADDVVVTFNKGSEDTSYDPEENASYDSEQRAASKAFPKTTYVLSKVKQPGNIDGVPYGIVADAAGVSSLLPNSTNVLTTDGREFTVDIEWGAPVVTSGGEDEYAAKAWTALGTVKLPDGVGNKNNVSLEVTTTVSVEAAPIALSPSMSLADGTYENDQWSTLVTDEPGGTTYYTVGKFGDDGGLAIGDPTDPSSDRRELDNDDNEFFITRLAAVPTTTEDIDADDNLVEVPVKSVIVKAYTEAAGKRPSSVATFEYQFRDIAVPEGQDSEYDGEEHIGVQANSYYTLSVGSDSSARVDEYGNVVATMPGSYFVTAELLLANDYWEAETDSVRTQESKTIEFTISGDTPLSSCELDVVASPAEGGKVSGAGTYVEESDVTVKAWANEGYEFVNWTVVSDDPGHDGEVASEDFAYTFPIVGDLKLQANFLRVSTVRWLDADGNEVDRKTYRAGEDEPTTAVKPVKQADAQYTYTFAGWTPVAGDDDAVKTYSPRYTKTVNKYMARFVNQDGTLLQESKLDYGAVPEYTGATPTKDATAEKTFAFAGWDVKPSAIAGDTTYTATYAEQTRTYTIEFVDDDGSLLQCDDVAYGETPAYTGATPTKAATAELVYVFKGWDQEITDVTGDATYKATYIEVPYTDKYYCAEGFGTTWTKSSGDSLRLTFKRIEDDDQTFNRFAGIQVDGQSVAEGTSNYIVAKGSAIILLQPSYLETLSVGQHVMKAVFDDGEAQASFEVKAGSSNSDNADSGSAGSSSAATKPSSSGAAKTGDPLAALPAIAVTLAVASACCLVFVGYARRRRE